MMNQVLVLVIVSLLHIVQIDASSTVLVTGGAGFIGYHASLRLKGNNYDVIVLDNFNDDYDVNLKKDRASILKEKGVTIYDGNAADERVINYIFKYNNITSVIHCAAYNSVDGNNEDPLRGAEDNIKTLVSVLDTIAKFKMARLIYMSSADVYGDNTPPFSVPTTTLDPLDILATYKYGMEQLAAGYAHDYNVQSIGLRLFTVYGPWSRPDTLVHDMATNIHSNKPISILHIVDTPLSRDFVYIDDVIDSIMLALKYKLDNKMKHKIFNIATGISTPLPDIAKLLQNEMRKSSLKQVRVSATKDDVINIYGDISDSKTELKFAPKIDIKTGVKRFVQWWKEYQSKQTKENKQKFDDSIQSKSFDDYIEEKNHIFRERLADTRENYTAYAKANNIEVAKFYRHKTFKFIAHKDTLGNIRKEANKTFEHMKKICDLIDNCVAFNTKGEIKSIHEIKTWKTGSGIYIADIDVCQAGLHDCFPPKKCVYKGPAKFGCVCDDNYVDMHSKCIEKYVAGKTSTTESHLQLDDRLSGTDIEQFKVNINEKFIPYKSKNSNGGELLYVADANGDISKLTRACQATYRCIGFSTDGILKKSVEEMRKWKQSILDMYLLDHIAKKNKL